MHFDNYELAKNQSSERSTIFGQIQHLFANLKKKVDDWQQRKHQELETSEILRQVASGDIIFWSDPKKRIVNGVSPDIIDAHLGIILKEQGQWKVIDTSAFTGIEVKLLGKAIEDTNNDSVITIKRPKKHIDANKLSLALKSYSQRQYDDSFLVENDKFTCAELVYNVLSAQGVLIGTPIKISEIDFSHERLLFFLDKVLEKNNVLFSNREKNEFNTLLKHYKTVNNVLNSKEGARFKEKFPAEIWRIFNSHVLPPGSMYYSPLLETIYQERDEK